MFLGHIKSGQAYLVTKRDQNQRHSLSCPKILIFLIKQYLAKEMFHRHLKQKIILNYSFQTEQMAYSKLKQCSYHHQVFHFLSFIWVS